MIGFFMRLKLLISLEGEKKTKKNNIFLSCVAKQPLVDGIGLMEVGGRMVLS